MQTPPETMLSKESEPKTKPVDATAVGSKKEDAVAKQEDPPKAPVKDPEQKPTAAGNGGEPMETQESNSTAEPKAKTPEIVETKSKSKSPELPKAVPKEAAKVENSKTDAPSKSQAEDVSASKTSEATPAEEEPMDVQDGGDDKKDEKKEVKVDAKEEPKVETSEVKVPAKRGRKRKADIEQKEIEVEATVSRPKRTREVPEVKVEEKRTARKRAAKTEASMKEEADSEDDENNDEDYEEEEEEEPKKKKRGRKPKADKPAKQPKKPKHTGPTLDIPTVEGNTVACSAGDGEVGQLGIGEQGENGKSRFVAIEDVPDKVVRCAAGGMHSLLLTEKGEIFSFGCNDDGSLGRPTENEEECFVPKRTPLPEPVAKLAAGNIHSVAVTKNCKVYIWGSYRDNNGAFGIQPEGDAPLRQPTELKVPEAIVDVACGSEHTLLLSNKGNIYSMGVGEQGRLGRLKSSHCGRENRRARQTLLSPIIVPVRKRSIKFDRVWAGRFNTFARTTDGAIWGCGLNNYGQLGELDAKSMEDNFVFFLVPLKSFDPKIKWEQICGGEQHTLALDADGSVYSMGRVLYGRLGLGKKDANEPDVKKPTLIPELEKKCALIAAGDHTSFALDKNGQLWSWGQGTNLLGQGPRDDAEAMDIFVPTVCTSKTLRDHKVVFASAGSNHALCVVKSE